MTFLQHIAMTHTRLAGVAAGILLLAAPAAAQSGRMASLPAPRPAPQEVPVIVLDDGSVVADFGRGYERLLRSCTAHFGGTWPGGQARGRGAGAPPQGGSASRPPNANGLPPVPGMSPAPGGNRPTVGTTAVGKPTVGMSSAGSAGGTLQPVHSGWRTAGTAYYDGACYTHDAYGRLRLIRL